MAARRGRRSQAAKLSRQADKHRRSIERALASVVRDAELDAIHSLKQDTNRALRGVGVVTRGMAAPVVASVTRMTQGQWQAMPSDVPAALSDARALEYRKQRDLERAATNVSNRLLQSDREAMQVQSIADAMRGTN